MELKFKDGTQIKKACNYPIFDKYNIVLAFGEMDVGLKHPYIPGNLKNICPSAKIYTIIYNIINY